MKASFVSVRSNFNGKNWHCKYSCHNWPALHYPSCHLGWLKKITKDIDTVHTGVILNNFKHAWLDQGKVVSICIIPKHEKHSGKCQHHLYEICSHLPTTVLLADFLFIFFST